MMQGSEDDGTASVKRNVTEAFKLFMTRLGALYPHPSTPDDFWERINFWKDSYGLPKDVVDNLHKLRKWRNASEHAAADPGQWERDGPRGGSEEVLRLIAWLHERIPSLEPAVAAPPPPAAPLPPAALLPAAAQPRPCGQFAQAQRSAAAVVHRKAAGAAAAAAAADEGVVRARRSS